MTTPPETRPCGDTPEDPDVTWPDEPVGYPSDEPDQDTP